MRKKSVSTSILLSVTILLSLLLFNSTVYAAEFELEIGSIKGYRGEVATVPVSFKNVPAAGINNCDFAIKYDTNIMEVVEDGVIPGAITKNSNVTFDKIIDKNNGIIKFLYCDESGLGSEAIKSDGVFASIKFLIRQNTSLSINKIRTTGELAFGNTYLEYVPANIKEGGMEIIEKQGYKVYGYISPDFATSNLPSSMKSGFNVEIIGAGVGTQTDENGLFQLYIDNGAKNCTLSVAKDGFLSRKINNVSLENSNSFTEVSTLAASIKMWAGDINNDGAINMIDIIEISKVFNSSKADGVYSEKCDLNKDGQINMADIVAIAQHFNRVTADYNI
jgi:hypothetical protein